MRSVALASLLALAWPASAQSVDLDGGMTLAVRNSWGDRNPDIPEHKFCRISRVTWVLTPTEQLQYSAGR